ncbi:toll/interleukin-1 receptor domain-containing protein [Ideonella sp. 4Y11]|uniref:Toll/interleukin-1 receptor domain-containing protein n=1 Tax=Ideonella aquatica TaxID=2824119 RepID=A0A941BFF7_9BURK|nr:toll/interleukin-1 receptor domain-containing protein [Ideonella aquatica]MBQ0958721.1 toll/interleukin-1 receptor domain-containing protein [Ideonella aquatica]
MPSPPPASVWTRAALRWRHLEPPGWVLLSLAVVALGLWRGGTVPPWPGGSGPLTAVLAVAGALALGRWRAQRRLADGRALLIGAAVLMLVATGVFLALLSRYTFTIPSTGEVAVKGFVCTPEARLIYPLTCPDDDLDALRSAEYEATRIWQAWSVDLVRLGLLLSWFLAWTAACWLATGLARPGFQSLIRHAPATADGQQPYLFVSYAHADLAALLPILDRLHAAGQPLWFDKGLEGASDWDTSLALQVQGCQALLLFLSPASVASPWVQREVRYADDLGKPVFAVRIGDTALTPALALRLGRNQVIEGSPDEIAMQVLQRFSPPSAAG